MKEVRTTETTTVDLIAGKGQAEARTLPEIKATLTKEVGRIPLTSSKRLERTP